MEFFSVLLSQFSLHKSRRLYKLAGLELQLDEDTKKKRFQLAAAVIAAD